MNATVLLIAMSATGIDFGWEPVVGGGIHYIVQIDPKMLDSMKEGTIVSSDLPEVPGGIRRYQIVVGTGPLPHQGEPLPQAPPPSAAPPVMTQPLAQPPLSQPPSTPSALPPSTVTPPAVAAPPATTFPDASPPFEQTPPAQPTPMPGPAVEPPYIQSPEPAQDPAPPGAHESPVVTSDPPFPTGPRGKSTFAPNRSNDPMTTSQPALDHSVRSEPAESPAEEKPWIALMLTLMGLFASLGGNVFLGMVAWTQRTRFDELAARLKRGLT